MPDIFDQVAEQEGATDVAPKKDIFDHVAEALEPTKPDIFDVVASPEYQTAAANGFNATPSPWSSELTANPSTFTKSEPEDIEADPDNPTQKLLGKYSRTPTFEEYGQEHFAKPIGQAFRRAGTAARGMAEAYAFEALGEPQLQMEALKAGAEGKPSINEDVIQQMPTGQKLLSKATIGLEETTPQLAGVAALEAAGVPAPISAGAIFGATPEGWSTKDAVVAAAIPFVGKYGGEIAGKLAQKAGISSDQALQVVRTIGNQAAVNTGLTAMQAADIAKLPADKRKDAWVDAIASDLGMGLMGLTSPHKTPQDIAAEHLSQLLQQPLTADKGTYDDLATQALDPRNSQRSPGPETTVEGAPAAQPSSENPEVASPSQETTTSPLTQDALNELQQQMTANQIVSPAPAEPAYSPDFLPGRALLKEARARAVEPTVESTDAPSQPIEESKGEQIANAALRLGDKVYEGTTHFQALQRAADDLGITTQEMPTVGIDYGFVTNTGRFIARDEAASIADENGGVAAKPNELHSGDIYSGPIDTSPEPQSANIPFSLKPRDEVSNVVRNQTPPPDKFDSVDDLLKFRRQRLDEEVNLYKEQIGLSQDQALQLQGILSGGRSTATFEKTLGPEQRQRLEWFFEESPYNKKNGPFQFWDIDRVFNPEAAAVETDKAALAETIVRATAKGFDLDPTSDRFLTAAIAARRLREMGGTQSDIARALDRWTTGNSGSQGDKVEYFKSLGNKIVTFLRSQGIALNVGDLQKYASNGSRGFEELPPRTLFSKRVPQGGSSAADAEAFLKPILERWKAAPEIRIVQSESDLPPDHYEGIKSAGAEGRVEGYFSNGVVYLVADNLPNTERLKQVVFHETVGHFGMGKILGKDFTPFMRSIAERYENSNLMREIAQDYNYDLSDPADRVHAAEEVVARLAEGDVSDPSLWGQIVGKVKEWWRLVFGGTISDEEIKNTLAQARRSVEGEEGAEADPQGRRFSLKPAKDWSELYADWLKSEHAAQEAIRIAGNPEARLAAGLTKAEAMRERALAAARSRTLHDELYSHPGFVEETLKVSHETAEALQKAREAGDKDKVSQLNFKLEGLQGQLDQMPPKMVEAIHEKLFGKIAPATGNTSLTSLVSYLRANESDSPKMTWQERLNLSRRLADEWSKGRDAMSKAYAKTKAGWEALKQNFSAPPVDDDWRSLFKSWLYEKQFTGLETHNWVTEIKKAVESKVRRMAISVYLDAGGDENLLRDQASQVPARWKHIWDIAQRLTPGEKSIAERVKADFEEKLTDAQRLGLIDKGRSDYGVPQLWDILPQGEPQINPEEGADNRSARNPKGKLDPRSPFFALQRTQDSYFAGIMNKGIPKSLDIADLVGAYMTDFNNSMSDRGMIWALKDAVAPDGATLVKISGNARIDINKGQRTYLVDTRARSEADVTPDGRPYRTIDHWALRDWKFGSKTEEGSPVIIRGDFLVHPDYYKFLKNELSQSWFRDPEGGGKFGHFVLNAAALLKSSKFALAPFHLKTLAEHALFYGVLPHTMGVELSPENDPKLRRLMRNGLSLGFDGQRELFEDGLSSHGGVWARVPGLGDAMSKMGEFLWKDYLPKLKYKTAQVILERNLKRYSGKISDDQIYEITANQVNAAFGGQNWKLLGTNKTMLDVNRMLLTAPDFLLSRAKVVTQAFKPYGREQFRFLLTQAAVVYTITRVLNYLIDGDAHTEPENALSVVYNGRAYSSRFLVSDLFHMFADTPGFLSGRLGPGPRAGYEAFTGRDMRTGARKTVPFDTTNPALHSAQIVVHDLSEWFVPAGVEGFMPGAAGREQTKASQLALALMGFGSHKYTAQTQMMNLAAQFNRKSDAKGQFYQKQRDDEAQTTSTYRKLNDLLEAGDMNSAKEEYQALLNEGKKPVDIAKHYAEIYRPFTGNGVRENQFKQSLDEHQKQIYAKAIAERKTLQQAFLKMAR